MEARVRPDSPLRTVYSCSGREFIMSEWRSVPDGYEAEAERNPYLETRSAGAPALPVEQETAPAAGEGDVEAPSPDRMDRKANRKAKK